MSQQHVGLEAEVVKPRSKSLDMERRSQDLRKAVVAVRKTLSMVRADNIPGIINLNAYFESAST